jgi:hypothetical protein
MTTTLLMAAALVIFTDQTAKRTRHRYYCVPSGRIDQATASFACVISINDGP